MGQRLVVEIRKTDKETGGFRSLAAAYYHWSAYTEDAIDLMLFLIDKYKELREKYTDDLELAVRMLEASGAGLWPEEKIFIEQAHMLPTFDIQDCENRNKACFQLQNRELTVFAVGKKAAWLLISEHWKSTFKCITNVPSKIFVMSASMKNTFTTNWK